MSWSCYNFLRPKETGKEEDIFQMRTLASPAVDVFVKLVPIEWTIVCLCGFVVWQKPTTHRNFHAEVDWYAIRPHRAGFVKKITQATIKKLWEPHVQRCLCVASLVWSARFWGEFCQYATQTHRAGLGHNGKHTLQILPEIWIELLWSLATVGHLLSQRLRI